MQFVLKNIKQLLLLYCQIPVLFLMVCLLPFLYYTSVGLEHAKFLRLLFSPSSELMAFEPRIIPFVMAPDVSRFLPSLKTLPNIPLPVCVLRFLCCLGPIVRFLLMVTFEGRLSRLTLSYLATKDRPFSRVIPLGVILHLNNILSLYILNTFTSPPTNKYFFHDFASCSN